MLDMYQLDDYEHGTSMKAMTLTDVSNPFVFYFCFGILTEKYYKDSIRYVW